MMLLYFCHYSLQYNVPTNGAIKLHSSHVFMWILIVRNLSITSNKTTTDVTQL